MLIEAPKTAAWTPQAWPLSVDAYHALGDLGLVPEKTELLYGQVFPKMPKSPFHRFLSQRLLRLLQKTPLSGCFIWQEQPITCAESEPEPDLSVIRGEEDAFADTHPRTAELVIEVCVTSHEYDRSKLRAYARAGVKECWLVLGPEKQVEVYRLSTGESFSEHTVHGPGGSLASIAVPNFTVGLTSLFAV